LEKPAKVYGDNQGSIYLIKNRQVGPRTKHIDIRHHWMRGLQSRGEIDVKYRSTERMAADINTKNTPVKVFDKHASDMRNGMIER